MNNLRRLHTAIWLAPWLLALFEAPAADRNPHDSEKNAISPPGILWRDPADIASRNLLYGSGGEKHQPRGPFTFVKEDLDGSNPKFTIVDSQAVKWKVKLGQEARCETAASRLVWAVGYFTTDDYYLPELQVPEMPRLQRGQKLVGPGGVIQSVRLKRDSKDEKKLGIWRWDDPGWANSREFNGLRVMMAVINNWDLKDVNNAVFQKGQDRIFLVSDLGASFATPGRSFPEGKAKDNVEEFWKSDFIKAISGDFVDFTTPGRPAFVYAVAPKEYFARVHMQSIGDHIPRADARWLGGILARLSPKQIRDAFRCAGYAPEEVEIYAPVIEKRIRQLEEL